MRLVPPFLLALMAWAAAPSAAQDRATERMIVQASEPEALAVTVYRDPNRGPWRQLDPEWPQGFAMISETRTVTLPAGESRIRFEGVAEGMVAVSAIVTGLPGGTIEKNRNAELLSPAALVDGTLGNRVTITRTNPATGTAVSQDAIVRTRADGGLVLQTQDGYEAVRCSGLAEGLSFDGIPDGLSAQPVFSIDTRDDTGGTYTVTLTYLSWGFDWQADYIATVDEGGSTDDVRFDLTAWLTILNDNGQSFEGAELMAVAGRLNVVSDFQQLADPPDAPPLRLSCYPIGSTAAGSPVPVFPSHEERYANEIVVSGVRRAMADAVQETPVYAMAVAPPPPPPPVAGEEQLGNLKLYRVPFPTDVNAQGLKQIAFIREEGVEGELAYEAACNPWSASPEFFRPVMVRLDTVNDEEHGLGVALPAGAIAVFESAGADDYLIAENNLRDYASGQDVEVNLGVSNQVFVRCEWQRGEPDQAWRREWTAMEAELTNANPHPVIVGLLLGPTTQWDVRGVRTQLRNGQRFVEFRVPANGTRTVNWQVRPPQAEE